MKMVKQVGVLMLQALLSYAPTPKLPPQRGSL